MPPICIPVAIVPVLAPKLLDFFLFCYFCVLAESGCFVLQVELTAVKPDVACKAQQEEEYRLSASLLPLRLRLHQSMISFLQSFFAVPVTASANSPQQKPSGTCQLVRVRLHTASCRLCDEVFRRIWSHKALRPG